MFEIQASCSIFFTFKLYEFFEHEVVNNVDSGFKSMIVFIPLHPSQNRADPNVENYNYDRADLARQSQPISRITQQIMIILTWNKKIAYNRKYALHF